MSLRGFATLNIWADDVRPPPTGTPSSSARALLLPTRSGRRPGVHRVPDRRLGRRARHHRPPLRPARGGQRTRRGDHALARRRLEGTLQRLIPGRDGVRADHPASEGFVTASVVDPFGNVLGVMYNPHYVEMVGATRTA